MKNSIDYIQENLTDIIGSSLTMEQRSKLKTIIEESKVYHKEEMKKICYQTLETCYIPQPGSLNDYFELTYNQVFNKQ
jgi:hypothetical protein